MRNMSKATIENSKNGIYIEDHRQNGVKPIFKWKV